MGFGGSFKKAFKKVKKTASKAFSAPNKIVSNVVSKVPVVGKPVEDFLQGKGPLGSLEKYLDPGSALVKNFTNDPENFISNLGGYKDDLGKIKDFGQDVVKGIGNMIDPPKPEKPPKPNAPDYANLWKEYSTWTSGAKQQMEGDIAMSRARLEAAGATQNVINEAIVASKDTFAKKLAGYQTSSTHGLLQEGYKAAHGMIDNPYAEAAKGTVNKAAPLSMEDFYASGYASGAPEEDPAKAALGRAKRARGAGAGAGGGGAPTGQYAMNAAPGQNPWVVS